MRLLGNYLLQHPSTGAKCAIYTLSTAISGLTERPHDHPSMASIEDVDPIEVQRRVITKKTPTGVRFEIRRTVPYPKKAKGQGPRRDVSGDQLVESDSGPRRNGAQRRQNRNIVPTPQGRFALSAIAKKSEAVARFLYDLRERQHRLGLERQLQDRLLQLLRREGVEPTWLGVGQQTPFEKAFTRKREVQDLLNEDDHRLELGPGYDGASANIVNIAATFSLGIVDIDTKGILLESDGIEGYFGTRRFPACNVYLMLEQYGKVLSVRMFQSGKVSITGAKSQCEALHGAHLFVNYLRRHGIECFMLDFQIRNVVLVFNVGKRIDIDRMSGDFPKLMPAGDGALLMDASAPLQGNMREARVFVPIRQPWERIDARMMLEGPQGSRALVRTEPPKEPRWSPDERDNGLPRPTVVNNTKFSALILRIDPDRPPAVLVNPSGTGVLCGASSVEAAVVAIQRALRIMMRYTYDGPAPNRLAANLGSLDPSGNPQLGVIDMVAQFASCDDSVGDCEPEDVVDETEERLRRERLEAECVASLLETDRGDLLFGSCLNELVQFEVISSGFSELTVINAQDSVPGSVTVSDDNVHDD